MKAVRPRRKWRYFLHHVIEAEAYLFPSTWRLYFR